MSLLVNVWLKCLSDQPSGHKNNETYRTSLRISSSHLKQKELISRLTYVR